MLSAEREAPPVRPLAPPKSRCAAGWHAADRLGRRGGRQWIRFGPLILPGRIRVTTGLALAARNRAASRHKTNSLHRMASGHFTHAA
jgi:hypothetical protein